MSAVKGVMMVETELRVIPKFSLTLEETAFALGSIQLANDLRAIEALRPANKHGRTLLFDAGHVEAVWTRYKAGEFDAELSKIRRKGGFEA